MDQEARKLAILLIKKLEITHPSYRLLVGISGIPASGKSTFAALLIAHVKDLLLAYSTDSGADSSAFPQGILVGLDGWHLSRADLDKFADPKTAHERRGIHWTFDGMGYVTFMRSLREPLRLDTPILSAPSFDHALKDPTYNSVAVHPYHRIVIIEGLYTFLSVSPWKEAALCLDERWFVEVDINEAKERLVKRHVMTGIAKDAQHALRRAEENDIPNGRFVVANMLEPTQIIQSIKDPLLTQS